MRWNTRPWQSRFPVYSLQVRHDLVKSENIGDWSKNPGNRYGFGRHLWDVPAIQVLHALKACPNPITADIQSLTGGIRLCLPFNFSTYPWSRSLSWRFFCSSSGYFSQTERLSSPPRLESSAASYFTQSSSFEHSLSVPRWKRSGTPMCRVTVSI